MAVSERVERPTF